MALWRIEEVAPGVGVLTWADADPWWLDPQASSALATRVEQSLNEGLRRVEAVVAVSQDDLRRTLQRAGLRPEGVARSALTGADGIPVDAVRLARLVDDAAPGTREAFNAMLNATLPVKRVIAQGFITDGAGRFLMCELTYKLEWDLPGGVVDRGESPADAVAREVREELGVELGVGRLVTVDWLPPYRRWDDAVLCVFDLGQRPDLLSTVRLQPTEIRAAHWCDLDTARRHAAPYVVRLLEHIMASRLAGGDDGGDGSFGDGRDGGDGSDGTTYLEDGRPT